MRTIIVHPTDSQADATSITKALSFAQSGDVVLVQTGQYSPTRTGEQLPLVIPPGVSVIGADKHACCIDGEGQFAPSFNPIRTDLSVITLSDFSSLSHLTVSNGGGHGVAVPPGSSATIHDCTISQHGGHGIYLCGVTDVTVSHCEFLSNGRKRFEPSLPRGVGARQGHHIFAEARSGHRNRLVVSDNTMRECFADGLAFICFFSQPDGVSFEALVQRNTIEDSERGGLLFCGSFGPSQNQLRLTIADNTLRNNKQFGLSVIGAFPLGEKVPCGTSVHAGADGNVITGSPIGILAQGAVGEAHSNASFFTLVHNRVADCGKNALRLVGAVGMDGVATSGNSLTAALAWNSSSGNAPAAIVQGAGGVATGGVRNNNVTVQLLANTSSIPYEEAFLVSDGLAENRAEVASSDHAWTQKAGNLLS
ncbi:MAG: DUF1565 domain-containing protein [Deltaproteobacteria bacterium]|nr:DUF1565 domain-containing protein [Deltaproteobacteria bacterium]